MNKKIYPKGYYSNSKCPKCGRDFSTYYLSKYYDEETDSMKYSCLECSFRWYEEIENNTENRGSWSNVASALGSIIGETSQNSSNTEEKEGICESEIEELKKEIKILQAKIKKIEEMMNLELNNLDF
jgi:excinuclease UvrABC helicase subunit UvrB